MVLLKIESFIFYHISVENINFHSFLFFALTLYQQKILIFLCLVIKVLNHKNRLLFLTTWVFEYKLAKYEHETFDFHELKCLLPTSSNNDETKKYYIKNNENWKIEVSCFSWIFYCTFYGISILFFFLVSKLNIVRKFRST